MGTGHCKFFYDKGYYLLVRTNDLYDKCTRRGFQVKKKEYRLHPPGLNKPWSPSQRDKIINRARIKEKLLLRPGFYRKNGRPVLMAV